ncbi:MAG TPA: choice-of-anchor Q domain-containing protein, partial [Verrucomicrobiaceae bacterium]
TLTQCTVANNSAPGVNSLGGAIYNLGTVSVVQSTIAQNGAGNGGGICSFNPLNITNSIIAGNTLNGSGVGPDIYNNASLTKTGANIVQSAIFNNGSITGTGTIANVNPLLATIDFYGGPTQTMALLPGSPARNAAVGSTSTSDQRGFAITDGQPDIGAYEAGNVTNFNAWIYESLPASANAIQHLSGSDFDGDGVSNYNEWLALTNPADPTSYFHVTNSFISNGYLNVFFPTVTGRNYTVEYATELGNPTVWTVFETIPGNGGTGASAIGPLSPGLPHIFVHVRTGP